MVGVADGGVIAVVCLDDQDVVLSQRVPDFADPCICHPQTVGIGADIFAVPAEVCFLDVGADKGSFLLLDQFQGPLQNAGRVHHRDAGAVVIGNHIGHLTQQENRQAAAVMAAAVAVGTIPQGVADLRHIEIGRALRRVGVSGMIGVVPVRPGGCAPCKTPHPHRRRRFAACCRWGVFVLLGSGYARSSPLVAITFLYQ